MMCYDSEIYVFTLKQIDEDIFFRVWNNELQDYEIIKIIENSEMSDELFKNEIKSFINDKIESLKVILNSLEKIGDE